MPYTVLEIDFPEITIDLLRPVSGQPTTPAAMLPAQLLSVLHYPLWMPSLYPPFAKCAKDGAAAAVAASAV